MKLDQLAGGRREGPGDGCQPAEDLAALAAGLTDASRSEQLLAHAAQCDACGAILSALAADFSDPPGEAEAKSLMEFKSATPEWPRETARKMAQAAGRGRVIPLFSRTWLTRAAAVMVAAGAGWMAWVHWGMTDAAPLIAEAYAEQNERDYAALRAAAASNRLPQLS